MNNYIFFHVCSVHAYREIFLEMYTKSLPLLKNSVKMIVSIVGPGNLDGLLINEPNVEIIHSSTDITAFEFPTLELMKKICLEDDCKVCYVHTRGVTHPTCPCAVDHRHYMSYFNLERWETCVEKLDVHDAVGVDYSDWPFRHFSGNFWWSKSSWINKLTRNWQEVPTLDERHIPEFWLGSLPGGNFCNLWSSGIHPMQRHLNRYEPFRYRLE
jgi:hypothetical protein